MTERSPFGHDPTDADRIPPDAITDYETVREAVEEGEDDGVGFVTTRHDEFLVVEIADAFRAHDPGDDELDYVPQVAALLDVLGRSYIEHDPGISGVRVVYEGDLPGERRGGPPVVATLSGTDADPAPRVRLYDGGVVAVTRNRIEGAPEDPHPVDEEALSAFVDRATGGE